MRIHFILCFFILSHFAAFAQGPGSEEGKESERQWSYMLSYSGNNLWNPGISGGIDYPLLKRVKEKEFKLRKETSKTRIKTRMIEGSARLGFYWDPFSHSAFYLNGGVNYKRFTTYGFYYQLEFQPAGIHYSMLPETYEYTLTGQIEKLTLPGRLYYAPTFGIGIGKSTLSKLKNSFFIKLNTQVLYQYNSFILPVFILDIGKRF